MARKDLTEEEAEASLNLLLNNGSDALISAFLVLLRAKGETFEEVTSRLVDLGNLTKSISWLIHTFVLSACLSTN